MGMNLIHMAFCTSCSCLGVLKGLKGSTTQCFPGAGSQASQLLLFKLLSDSVMALHVQCHVHAER